MCYPLEYWGFYCLAGASIWQSKAHSALLRNVFTSKLVTGKQSSLLIPLYEENTLKWNLSDKKINKYAKILKVRFQISQVHSNIFPGNLQGQRSKVVFVKVFNCRFDLSITVSWLITVQVPGPRQFHEIKRERNFWPSVETKLKIWKIFIQDIVDWNPTNADWNLAIWLASDRGLTLNRPAVKTIDDYAKDGGTRRGLTFMQFSPWVFAHLD